MYRYIYIIYIYKQSWERDPGAHFRAAQAHLLTAPTSPHPKCPNSQTPTSLSQDPNPILCGPKAQTPKAKGPNSQNRKPEAS